MTDKREVITTEDRFWQYIDEIFSSSIETKNICIESKDLSQLDIKKHEGKNLVDKIYLHIGEKVTSVAKEEALKKISSITFKNCSIAEIHTISENRCEKLIIDNCTIKIMRLHNQYLSYPKNITIQNNSIIDEFEVSLASKKLSINDTKIKKIKINSNNNGKNGSIYFKKCTLGNKESKSNNLDFTDTTFDEEIIFDKCTFIEAPLFFKSTFKSNFDFRNCTFKDFSSQNAENAYSNIKKVMLDNGFDYNAIIFNALELRARHETRLYFRSNAIETTYSFLYGVINDFGFSFARPIYGLIILSVIAYFLYCCFGSFACNNPDNMNDWFNKMCENHNQPLYLAVRNLFGPLGLYFADDRLVFMNWQTKTLSATHLILSSFLWFIIFLQARMRFKIS